MVAPIISLATQTPATDVPPPIVMVSSSTEPLVSGPTNIKYLVDVFVTSNPARTSPAVVTEVPFVVVTADAAIVGLGGPATAIAIATDQQDTATMTTTIATDEPC
ncbi:hypothetical protein GUJ93_ZPchr0005g14530 [Zizania palustris]|uniref:Uncharacterized protein n=1 Tax=Zizania palustris TaxID=103762 RepID=A0A8J5SCL1_ZIZPA|nr:hypothetical protein GUJ93_ZPchr0005g14530 [Zizania palustris]